ncbi:uncharacterized protein [Littorina saxatilis]|uniref:uncharacterized protein n=1 Tax=Littorina saxatilis TaxID=31220 RepID=UPI0038B6A5F2
MRVTSLETRNKLGKPLVMPVKRCSWGKCNSDARYPEKLHGVVFIPFVKPGKHNYHLDRCLRWIKACGRPHTQLSVDKLKPWTYVCSKHFVDGKPTEENPDPLPAADGSHPKTRKLLGRHDLPNSLTAPKRRNCSKGYTDQASVVNQLAQPGDGETGRPPIAQPGDGETGRPPIAQPGDGETGRPPIAQPGDGETGRPPIAQPGDGETGRPPIAQPGDGETGRPPIAQPGDGETGRPPIAQPGDGETGRPPIAHPGDGETGRPPIKCGNCGHVVQLSPEEEQMVVSRAFVSQMLRSDKSCFHYTGVPSVELLKFIFNWVKEAGDTVKNWGGKHKLFAGRVNGKGRHGYKMTKFECMILTLVRIRKGFDMEHLSFLYGISQAQVSRIFTTWVNVLNQCFAPLLLWPRKELCKKNLPEAFENYPTTRCVIDCTELRIEKPFRPRAQRLTWSNYKHGNTSKLLVAVLPSGAIIFKSKLYVGSISDKEIVKRCGFLEKLEQGDDVMADRGFNIRELLLQKKATLNIPSFSKGRPLSSKAVQRSRKIASVRIHVERAIGRMKTFKQISGIIPMKIRFLLNQIVTIVSVLCNLQARLC